MTGSSVDQIAERIYRVSTFGQEIGSTVRAQALPGHDAPVGAAR
jgi:hypothetical protein